MAPPRKLLNHADGHLLDAAQKGDAAKALAAIAAGADPKNPRWANSPLWWAAHNGHEACVAALIPHSHTRPPSPRELPIFGAIAGNSYAACEILIPATDMDCRDHLGRTPLMAALELSHGRHLAELLLPVSDPAAKDSRGLNALMLAALGSRPDRAVEIVASDPRCDPLAIDPHSGKTAMEMALRFVRSTEALAALVLAKQRETTRRERAALDALVPAAPSLRAARI